MIKPSVPMLFLILCTTCPSWAASIDPIDGDRIEPDLAMFDREHVPGQLLVRFQETLAPIARADLLAQVSGSIRQSFWLVPGLVSIETDLPLPWAAAQLAAAGDVVRYVEPVYVVHALDTVPNDPYLNQLYGMEQIHAPLAWDQHTGDGTFVIAVIDTGVDYGHQDLADNVWTNPGEVPGNGVDDDGNGYIDDVHGWDFYNNDADPMDDNSHGTHCGGTVGAVGNNSIGVVGVNWNCRLAGVKFLGAGGSGSIEGAIGAVQYCVANEFKVSNNSWGAGGNTGQSLYDAIQNAGDQFGHVFCAAAGNSGSYGAIYPGAYDCTNIICIGATNSSEGMAGFSQYHPEEVDLAAPGVDVLSTVPANEYSAYSGTSMATPHVSGGVALVASLIPNASAEMIKEVILSTSRPIPSWKGHSVTGGVLDVAAAIDGTFLIPQFTLESEIPTQINPSVSFQVAATLDPRDDIMLPGSVQLHYRDGGLGGWADIDMTLGDNETWVATVPGLDCSIDAGLYLSCEGETAGIITFPSAGSDGPLTWFIGTREPAWIDDGETDAGWTIEVYATDGGWDRGVPIDCDRGDPPTDFDGSGSCWLTDNAPDDCNSDVDDGWTTLASTPIELANLASPTLSYARWFSNSTGGVPYTDIFTVQISVDGGSWEILETVGPDGPDCDGGWVQVQWDLQDIAEGAQYIQLRFTAADMGTDSQSIVEAAIDAISVTSTVCQDPSWGACCVGEDCHDQSDPALCQSLGGLYHEFNLCSGVTCGGAQEGACCLGDDCLFQSINECDAAGGAFAGVATQCDDIVCNDEIDLPMVTVSVGQGLVEGAIDSWTTDLYVVVGEGARIDVVAGTSTQAKVLSSSGTFYQDPYGGPTSAHINPAFYSEAPDLEWDSRVTIGAIDATGLPFPENALQDVGIEWTFFEGGGDLVVGDGAWFVLPTYEQGEAQLIMADDCSMVHAVRVARLTMLDTDDTVAFEAWIQGRDAENVVFDDPARIEAGFASLADCNLNGVSDVCDIAYGTSEDLDGDGVPDECQDGCQGDADSDGDSDIDDILAIIAAFETGAGPADVNGDGVVDIDDLLQVISFFGSC